jgi:hypothetical protein
VTVERIQRSIHPIRDFFTAGSSKKILAALVVGSDLISYLRERFKAARGGLA